MITPEVHEIPRYNPPYARRVQDAAMDRAAYAPTSALRGDAYRSRCAEIRELDRRADLARVTS